jgi:hypothetical protein
MSEKMSVADAAPGANAAMSVRIAEQIRLFMAPPAREMDTLHDAARMVSRVIRHRTR